MFPRSVRLLTIYGFDIKVDPSWLLIAALITWSLSTGYFPDVYPDQTTVIYLSMAILAMTGFFASLILHELSHAFVARQFNTHVTSITLFLFGGVAEMHDEPESATAEKWIAIAGPAMSLILSFGFSAAAYLGERLGAEDTAMVTVLQYLGTINLVLAVFNLLPAFPLDGGRILRAYLWQRNGDSLKATEAAAKSGIVLAYVLIGLGLVSLFGGYLFEGIWQILLGGFLIVTARASYQQQLQKNVFSGLTVAEAMTADPVTVGPDMTLSDVIDLIVLPKRVSFLPVVENGVLLGQVDSELLRKIDREHWENTRVDDVFVSLSKEELVSRDMPIPDLLDLIGRTGQRKFLVTEDRRLVGVITLADLARFMGLVRLFHQRRTA